MMLKPLLTAGVALCLAIAAVSGQIKPGPEQSDEYIKVEIKGIIQGGVVAVGGETTGTVITAKGITWELDLSKSESFRKSAEKLDGKTVLVNGSLELRKGVEIAKRWIVTVTSLKAGDGK